MDKESVKSTAAKIEEKVHAADEVHQPGTPADCGWLMLVVVQVVAQGKGWSDHPVCASRLIIRLPLKNLTDSPFDRPLACPSTPPNAD
jgi:hypothetical protein